MSSFRLLCQALPAALLLFATPTLDAQTVEFGTLLVTQLANNNNNLITPPPGISIAYGPGKSAAGGFAITANRADYDMDFGHANDTTTGMLMSSLAQLTRNDSAVGGPAPGAFYATSSSWIGTSKYTIAIHWSESNPDNTEVNYNTSYAFLPYNIFIGGIANNSSNNGEMTSLTGTTGLTLNTHFTDLSTPAGQYAVNLTGLVTNASQNGILLVTGAKNEDNYALSRANADGTFNIWCKDNANGTNTVFENDAVAFSYIPTSAIGTQGLTAIGRVNGNATTDVAAGTFTVTKGGTGQWYLQISGHSQSTGTLIISPEGGGTNNVDNIIASGWDAANNRWVIESRDINAVTPHVPTLQDMANATEDAFSFAFFAASNIAPVASITAPAASSFVTPATFTLEADATDANGSVTTVEFLRNGLVVGTDNSQPYTYTETGLTNGSYSYVARATDNSGATGVSTAKVITVTFDPNNLPANTALSFDGLNDYVTMGAAPELNVGGPPNNGLTLECWFRKEGTGITAGSGSGGVTAVPLFGKGRGESDGSNIDCNIFFGITTGGILVADFESQATGLNHPITATNAPIVNGTWYHAAVTYDGATSTWKMYLNGDEVGTATPSVAGSVPRFDSIQHFGIGTAMNSSGATEGAFAGVIDEARVWNRARSAAEIAAAKDLELSSGTGLIGRFGLNEATSTTAASSTGVSVGTLTNGPVWVPGAPFATANTSPTVTLTAPLNNAPSFMPFPVTFMADASDVGGSVTKIEFLVAGLKVGEDTTEPFTYAWTPPAIGTYSVRARAIDNLGATKLSTPADLIIQPNPNQPPVITLTAPADGATVTGTSTLLEANLADSTGDAMTVTFYGRQTVPAAPGADFTVVAIPDTQYYSEGSPSRANTVTVEQLIGTFGAQTQWVVDNQTSRNVAFLSHMGDIVENGNFNGNPIQWQRASAAMGRLENPVAALRAHGIPYGIAPGNHDIDPIGSYDSGSTTFYNQFFNLSRFAGRTYWGGNYGSDNTNNYQLFSASGLDFIAIHMAYDTTPNQPILDWADALMKAHPQRRAIVTSHYIIGQGNPAAFGAQGQAFYTNFKDNPNFFLMLCGHIHAEGRRSDIFEGRTVYSVLSDYQGLINGGQGFLRTLSFSPANNRIRVESWSPTLNRAAQASDGLPHFDGTFDLPYNMQSPISGWVPLGTVNVPANGTSASLNWTGLAAGKNYEWYVAANDGVNTASSAPHRFTTAAGIAPTVTLDTPATGATFLSPATINLTATAADADGSIVRVEFYQAGTKVGEDTTEPYEFTWSGVPVGSYTLSAVAVDNSNLASVSTAANVTVNPGDLPPTVTLTAPVAGTLLEAPANVTLTADASDQDGPVAKVEFYSGTLPPVLLGEETTVPFSLTLTNLGAGSYTFSAKATDSIGQTTTSATVTMSIFTEAAAPNVGTLSVGAFDPPSWTVTRTSPAPRHFNLPGSASGSLELKINSASVPFSSGIALVNNWNSLATIAAGFTSDDNISQPFANGSGNTFINVLDNSNNNAVGANPSTSAQTSGVGVAFLPYAAGWTGASVNSAAGVIASNLPAGVSMVKSGGGTYTVAGLSIAGNMLAVTNGNSGTLADNVCSVRIAGGQWVIDTRDNAGGTQDNEFTFVYIPPTTTGVYAGRVSAAGVVSNTNPSATSLGITASTSTNGVDLTFGDGSVINPTTAAIFLCANATNGGATSTAVDNLISWSANGNSFRVFTQDLEGVNGTNEAIDMFFVAIPYATVGPVNTVTITATDATAGEFGADQALSFTISRTGDPAAALTVALSATGSAISGSDYTGFQSSVVIPATQSSITLPLTVFADNAAEGDETVTITIGTSANYATGTPASANATVQDSPAQNYYVQNIPNAAKRGPTDDADDDGVENVIEYFMGTQPGNGNSAETTAATINSGNIRVNYPRALNRPDVAGVIEWSTDLINWFRTGQSNGSITVSITESTQSQPTDDPQIIEATVTITPTGVPVLIFFRLNVAQ